MWDKIVTALIGLVITSVAGLIAFFLRRTIIRVDTNETDIATIKETYAKKSDLEKLENSSAAQFTRLEGRMNEGFDNIDQELKDFRGEMITKDDFYREIQSQRKQNERIYDILLELKGGKRNG